MLRTKFSSTKPSGFFRIFRVSFSISTSTLFPSSPTHIRRHNAVVLGGIGTLHAQDVVLSFKQWFKTPQDKLLFDQIFQILSKQQPDAADAALRRLRLPLSEHFVLQVLSHGNDVLCCLKFFDWAGRQPGFYHTRATFHSIFKILARAKLMSVLLDLLHNYTERYVHRVRFNDTLVMGYAVAGKPELALQLFAKMRFLGLDLDRFAYHVLLNALVEENCFDAFKVVVEQIRMKGFESEITHSIIVKYFCKQGRLDEARALMEELVESNRVGLSSGQMVCVIVKALCKKKRFEEADRLVEGFHRSGMVPANEAYGVWIRELVRAGRLDRALEFLQRKKDSEGYVPQVSGFNILIYKLLKESRLEEVCDLLTEMKEKKILPNKVTMNAVLCFFCKAGMVDIALQLYDSRAEFGLSPSSLAYHYLINTLCADGSSDEAYNLLMNSNDQGYLPGKKTFSILANALCREGRLDKLKDLFIFALNRNILPRASTYDLSISALCEAGRVEDGYQIHGDLNRISGVAKRVTYLNLIRGFNNANRGDIAAQLLIEFQEKGHIPTRSLYRAVICQLCGMDNSKKRFFKLLEMQLSLQEPKCLVYNFFIDGAGHAKRPELAREAFEIMRRSGIVPNLTSDILMLQSYLKNGRISDALNFFSDLKKRRKPGRKVHNVMVVGLCKANKEDIALEILKEMKEKDVLPSLECYEELVKALCTNQRYNMVVNLIDDLERIGRKVSSFIGNVLLYHSLKTTELFYTWVRSSPNLMFGQLIGAFSGCIRVNQDVDLEEVVQQCFPLDLYTYNMLLKRLSMSNMDHALELFNRLLQKGYEPNRWTYHILVQGLYRHGRKAEAEIWMDKMFGAGFEPTKCDGRILRGLFNQAYRIGDVLPRI